jgi:TonB family protein
MRVNRFSGNLFSESFFRKGRRTQSPLPVNHGPEGRAAEKLSFGLLPEPEGRTRSFITSSIVNGIILALSLAIGLLVKPALVEHHYEQTLLILPNKPIEKPPIKVEPPKLPDPPKLHEVKLDAPKIVMPKIEPKPEKPIQMEAKLTVPVIKAAKPAVVLAPQPRAALTAAAMPAQDNRVKPSTAPVHLGETFGVTPNPNATRPATVAAIGNPYGGMTGPSIAPHGVVGSTGIGDGLKFGNNNGQPGSRGKVALAGIPGAAQAAPAAQGRVASTRIPAMAVAVAAAPAIATAPTVTSLEVLSKPAVQYTSEARQLKVQGDVVLRVTFTAAGQVQIQGLVHGLGHGLDEEARRVAQQIRFRPATRNGQAIDTTTNITITFQLA